MITTGTEKFCVLFARNKLVSADWFFLPWEDNGRFIQKRIKQKPHQRTNISFKLIPIVFISNTGTKITLFFLHHSHYCLMPSYESQITNKQKTNDFWWKWANRQTWNRANGLLPFSHKIPLAPISACLWTWVSQESYNILDYLQLLI